MDATGPVRAFLADAGLHDYGQQQQGPNHKVVLPASIVTEASLIPSAASLYRPKTKKGDPRIWFKGLPKHADANDIIALILDDGAVHVINITKQDIAALLASPRPNPLKLLVDKINLAATGVARELLAKLKTLAQAGALEAETVGDTAIGRTIETALGIEINSSKQPDYKGIELKSSRKAATAARENRKTLFAQVANWDISRCKSSAEILDNYGYTSGENFKLYCTVRTVKPNSQGLYFELDENNDFLEEKSTSKGKVVTWRMETLRERLAEKHAETFWITAKSTKKDGKEYFQLLSVMHTRSPLLGQFGVLLQQGKITMDHLIKRSGKKVSEKGPLFKVDANALALIFPPSETYDLLKP